jgi:hypothetical protein
MLSFNLTYLDVDHSRGFGIITRKKRLVHEALKLLAADKERGPYEAGASGHYRANRGFALAVSAVQ